VKSAGAYFHIKRLHDDAALLCPKLLQGENESLEGTSIRMLVHG
jgi:hypothetical protein